MAQPVAPWTKSAYLAMENASEDKHILWKGEIFAMTGARPRHVRLAASLVAELHAALKPRGPCRPYGSDLRVLVPAKQGYVYPDVSVVCPPLQTDVDDPLAVTNPTAIFEVLSESTEAFDRGAKFDGYRSIPSLADYVLVSQTEVLVEHFARRAEGKWELSVLRTGATLRLSSGAELSVDALYDGVLDEPL